LNPCLIEHGTALEPDGIQAVIFCNVLGECGGSRHIKDFDSETMSCHFGGRGGAGGGGLKLTVGSFLE
jgi:hypothetical protein